MSSFSGEICHSDFFSGAYCVCVYLCVRVAVAVCLHNTYLLSFKSKLSAY